MKRILIFVSVFPVILSCGGGLTLPPEVEPGITGKITVVSPWAHADSVDAVWLFASQIYPLDSALIFTGIFQGKILVHPSLTGSLPEGFDTLSFSFPLPPATYYYVGVLQRLFDNDDFNPNNYRVIGVYSGSQTSGQPQSVSVREDAITAGIDISADFYNLPPQPF